MAPYIPKTFLDVMFDERNAAPSDHFGTLPNERKFAEAIAERIQQYNEGLISSVDLYSFMHIEASRFVE